MREARFSELGHYEAAQLLDCELAFKFRGPFRARMKTLKQNPRRIADASELSLIVRAINAALAEIREHDPALASLLKTAIKTGQFFSYSPGPESKVKWCVELPADGAPGPQQRRADKT